MQLIQLMHAGCFYRNSYLLLFQNKAGFPSQHMFSSAHVLEHLHVKCRPSHRFVKRRHRRWSMTKIYRFQIVDYVCQCVQLNGISTRRSTKRPKEGESERERDAHRNTVFVGVSNTSVRCTNYFYFVVVDVAVVIHCYFPFFFSHLYCCIKFSFLSYCRILLAKCNRIAAGWSLVNS